MADKLHVISAAITDRGLSEKRPQNEDSFLEMDHLGVYAIADGVGGAEGGEVASQMAMEILGEAFANKPNGIDAEEILRNAIESANAAIYQTAQQLSKLSSMATTIVALNISENVATIGHVGDSRLYRVDPNGYLHRETEDHSMVADEVRAGRMTEEQAENHPGKNVINRALGAEPTVEADFKTILIEPRTTFLICSDGITRHVNDNEIKNILAGAKEPAEICAHLKTLCYERGAEDNLTAVVVRCLSDAPEKEITTGDLSGEEDTIATARTFSERESDTDDAQTEPNIRQPASNQQERIEMFSAYETDVDKTATGSLGGIATAFGMLLLGSLLGLGLYHFMLVPTPKEQLFPQLSEMKSENIAMTSFEKLRRTVDNDPASYLKEIPPARDAEDFYLQGRANLLIGDYVKARAALLESQKHLSTTDASNSKILVADIAAALVIANDVEMQRRFKGEIENMLKAQP
ncbi:MAG: serine/threonine-protein phosphatase [Chloracidobacterium sp.]|nr:serine/threonine-protein phosphatase [Chloracidobacterium sp.]